jgi:hypothetical protein
MLLSSPIRCVVWRVVQRRQNYTTQFFWMQTAFEKANQQRQ